MTSPRVGSRGVLACTALLLGGAAVASGQALTFTQTSAIPGAVELVRAEGRFVYLAHAKTFVVFDVSNASEPRRLGAYEFPEQIWGFRVAGARAFIAEGHSGLGILDLSNPSAPRLMGQVKTPGQAKNVSVAGNRAFVANHMSGIDIVDLSDATRPKLLGSAYVDGYARDVAAAGSVAVGVDNPSGVYVLDVAARNATDPLASLQSATAPQQVELTMLPGSPGRTLAVLAGSEPYDAMRAVKLQAGAKPRGGSIQFVDVTNPAAPAMVGTYQTSASGRRLAVSGHLVYSADGPDGLKVLDISTPSNPTLVGTFKHEKPARGVAVAGSLVFLIVGDPQPGNTGGNTEVLILRQAP